MQEAETNTCPTANIVATLLCKIHLDVAICSKTESFSNNAMDEPCAVQELLSTFDDTILRARGAVYEGELFAVLKSSPYVIRSFEFAPADGCVDCSNEFDAEMTYADRFCKVRMVERDPKQKSSQLLLFDIKSKISEVAGQQTYLTKGHQRHVVAFYLGLRAADPGFVELIPNFCQGLPDDGIYHAVNSSRKSRLPPPAYRLDMCSAPYRMPIYMLREALRRVRACAQGRGEYQNPWTLVRHPEWRPKTVDAIESAMTKSQSASSFLMPREDTEHFSACKAVLEIKLAMDNQSARCRLDFVGLQPLLADFKLIFLDPTSGQEVQAFVQHKLDVRDRSVKTPLDKVAIARSSQEGTKTHYYFNSCERFDYLFYEFNNISPGPGQPRITDIFFLPECVIPDEFYETANLEGSFENPNFQEYRIRKDKDGRWVDRILNIVLQGNLRRASRPNRLGDSMSQEIDCSEERSETMDTLQALSIHGRTAYSRISAHHFRQFFHSFMLECIKQRSGLLFALSHENPSSDFGYCRYQWTEDEASQFLQHGVPPNTVSDLFGMTNVLPLCLFVRDLECTFHGPEISSANYRRLTACTTGRLLIWNIAGPDDHARPGPLLAIPSREVEATQGQRTKFANNLNIDKRKEHSMRTPSVSAVLKSGLVAAEYAVGASGPLVYDDQGLCDLWKLCDAFTKQQTPIEHPAGRFHDPAQYLVPLSSIHMRHSAEEWNDVRPSASGKRKHGPEDEISQR